MALYQMLWLKQIPRFHDRLTNLLSQIYENVATPSRFLQAQSQTL